MVSKKLKRVNFLTLWLHLLLRSGQNPQVKVETPRVPHINTTGGLGSSVWKIIESYFMYSR